jgi:hypothetical protein
MPAGTLAKFADPLLGANATPTGDFLLDNDPNGVGVTLTVTRSGGVVTNLVWANTSSGLSIKSITLTRTAGLVTQILTQVYSIKDGTTVTAQTTATITRVNGLVTSTSTTRDV